MAYRTDDPETKKPKPLTEAEALLADLEPATFKKIDRDSPSRRVDSERQQQILRQLKQHNR